MPKQSLAIALCRVSSREQLENNSLSRQRDAVINAAKRLEVTIPENYWWSGSVSSKHGKNINRKDLLEIIDLCKKDKHIKYIIVDEPDRFMRSISEAYYFEVTFEQLGVTIWYASNPELNQRDLGSKLLKFTKYHSAEGSNEERQSKSISGQTKALLEGRYPFSPKPGYKRGYERGIQEIHPVRGPALRSVLVKMASRLSTPTQSLIELNKSEFMSDGHALYKMDKFRKIATDPFYAGIVEITRQINVRNENGLHQALITEDQHEALLEIMNGKKKTQTGPRKNGNPKYPLSNHVNCDMCKDKRNGRYVGYDHGNGKNPNLVYEKYRCRSCRRYLTRQDLHSQIEKQFSSRVISEENLNNLLKALDRVWTQKEGQTQQDANRVSHKINALNLAIVNQVEAATDPSNLAIKQDILSSITKKKAEINQLEEELSKLKSTADDDKEAFLRFAIRFVDNMGGKFLELSPDNRLRCKQLLFPAGFSLDANNKVYTPEISTIYRLAVNKKDLSMTDKSHLVRVRGL